MSDTQKQDADLTANTVREFTAPLRELMVALREMEATFEQERKFLLQHRPDEQVGHFPSLNEIETKSHADLEILKVMCELALRHVERRADEIERDLKETEKARAESLRQQSQSPLEARVEKLERALAYQGAEIAKLKGVHHGQLPALPHVSRSQVPQFLGMPSGMGRHGVAGPGGGVRKLGSGAPASDAPIESGFTRRQHPLDVIGGSGRR
jgi:hypothetical protein